MADKKSWFSTVKPFPSLVYPDDLNADNFYPDCVCFTVQKRLGVSIDDVTEAFGKAATTFDNKFNEKISQYPGLQKLVDKEMKGVGADKTKQEAAKQAAITKYKEENPKHGMAENMLEVLGSSLGAVSQSLSTKQLKPGKSTTSTLGSIYLNMPNGIQFNESANWAGQELGFMGKMTQDLITGGGATGDVGKILAGAAAGSAGSLVGAAVGAIPSLVGKLGISGGMFGAAIGAMAAGSPIQKGLESALGVAQNPYMEMMFTGVGFRKFNFEFILRPKSTKEVGTVADILKNFRTFSKPTFTEGDLGKSFMDYPMEFGIEFLTSGGGGGSAKAVNKTSFQRNMNVPQLKNCVCDNVTTNYTPQSIWAAHNGGVPVAVTLGLSFQETELIMAEDVHRDGY